MGYADNSTPHLGDSRHERFPQVPDDISGLKADIEARRGERDKAVGLAYQQFENASTETERAAAAANIGRMLGVVGSFDVMYPPSEGSVQNIEEG